MLNIFVCKKLDIVGLQHVHVLNYYFGEQDFKAERAGDSAIKLLNKQFFKLIDNPEHADYFLAPHDYFAVKDDKYWGDISTLTKLHNKKVIVFAYGDRDDPVAVENSIVFRTSKYKGNALNIKSSTEIIMPAIADDLSVGGLKIRNKQTVPVVGFCGWADFHGKYGWLKSIVISLTELFVGAYRKKGIILRKKILKQLAGSKLVSTNFIIRRSYSGNEKTRVGNFQDLRNEYINNILTSDLSLAAKGDGNFSIRFYEILSLGRIPLFIDTRCVLPLENVINYNDFILKVDVEEMSNLPKIVSEFYKKISESDFVLMQQKARDTFENYLRIDKYFDYMFNHEKSYLNIIKIQ